MHYANPIPTTLPQEQNDPLHQGSSPRDYDIDAYLNPSPQQQQQQQQHISVQSGLAILHPELSTMTLPSTSAPSIYALASTVPFPTVSQLSMNIPSNSELVEKVAVPFKTILHPLPATQTMNETSETTVATETTTNTRASPQERPLPEEAAGVQAIDAPLPDPTGVDNMATTVHPYFAAAKFPTLQPSSNTTVDALGTTPSTNMAEAEAWATVSPPGSTVPNPVHDPSRPGYIRCTSDPVDGGPDSEAPDESGTTTMGFAPLFSQGNPVSGEERGPDGSTMLPKEGGQGLSDNSDVGGNHSHKDQNRLDPSQRPRVPFSVPHVRAGIAPTLDLDPLKQCEVPGAKEQSAESLFETKDWSTTGLGPRENWDPELAMLMPTLMRSAAPLAVYWTDQYYLIYNDAWRPILKQKHPMAMGTPGATVWSEIWEALGSQMAKVRKQRRGQDNKALRLDLHREGYEEECYFDFTFSPIFLRDGSVGGILAVVNEVTQSILNQRRLLTLNQFSKQAPLIQSVDGAYSMITTILQESNNLDVPFSIVYKAKENKDASAPSTLQGTYSPKPANQTAGFTSQQQQDFLTTGSAAGTGQDLDGSAISKVKSIRSHFSAGVIAAKKEVRRAPQAAVLCSTSYDRNLEVVNYGGTKEKVFSKSISTRHIPDSLLITPEEYEPLDPAAPVYDDPWAWPVRSVLADGIPRLVTLPKSTHKLARALLLPILENPSALDSRITTVLIVGINPYQMLDNQYLDFLALLVANIASLLHFGQSREEERKSTEALFELNKAKISFFQNVSHELRTPLTLMLAPLDDVISQTPEKSPMLPNLEMIRRNSRRLLKLVNTLLQFSRIEAGKGLAVFEETDLVKATREISANFESVARGFSLEYIINCESLDGVPGGVWVDRAMWGGIILNLIGNAFKHTWEGSVTVHQYPCKGTNGRDGVSVDVKDTGVGISPDHLHTLFGRFNRIENKQSRSHEGTGIGLSLVKELTEVHGGTVSVTSEVDKGTCFHLWIPAGRSHHPSSQVKLNDSQESNMFFKLPAKETLNNKTDASMFVEEASQWIAQKSLPGSTLSASGTDSTEEEKLEEDDDEIGLDYMRDRHEMIEANNDFEVSKVDLDEGELSKILIDVPQAGEIYMPENSLISIDPTLPTTKRQSSTAYSPKTPLVDPFSSAFVDPPTTNKGEDPDSINDDGGHGEQIQTNDVADEDAEDDAAVLPQSTKSRRSFIIIVDDNNDMRAYLREILGRDFRVRCAVDGLDAIRLISERLHQHKRIDLILSDVAMPNMNGYELLKRLRNDPATMMMPFILLSARAGEEANVEGLDLGADDCLVKPFSARELLARVRSTIRLSDLRHELIREQRHAFEMKQLIYNISVRIRSGLSLPEILDTASRELFKVIRCNAIRICRFRSEDPVTGQHWVRFVSEIVRVGKPKILTSTDRLLPTGLEIPLATSSGEHDHTSDLRCISNYQHPIYGAKSFICVGLMYNRKIWGYLLASKDADMVDWSQSEKMLFEQTGNQISLAIAHASLWEMKKCQQVEMETAHAANEAKSQILANTSHELRTPIGAIVGALSALEDTDQNLTGEQRDMIKIMQITSDVALSVINDLLDTAKLEAGAMSLNIKECHGLIETLAQSIRIFADKAGRKEVDLIMESSEEMEAFDTSVKQGSTIWTDGDRLQQVIMNLIGNAVKFTPQGKVLIQCSFIDPGSPAVDDRGSNVQSPQLPHQQPHPRVHYPVPIPPDALTNHGTFRFEVTDTGIGIDPDFLKNHIFKSFAQCDQTMTRRFGGTGLGLAISKRLVMMNGGVLGVTSNVGQGSTFYFTWPFTLVTLPNKAPSLQRTLSSMRPMLSPDVAFETRAIVVEPVMEVRNVFSWMMSQQSVHVTLYESCDNVVEDEKNRNPDLLGPDGTVLTKNYRPNAHFFFCTRINTAEVTVATARALGELFKERNRFQREKGLPDHKDLIVSIVLVIFSSPQGRSMAKDMIKRIRGHGLDETVQCRYIVKPIKKERVVECLQTLGSYMPLKRGAQERTEVPEAQHRMPGQRHYARFPSSHPPYSQRISMSPVEATLDATTTEERLGYNSSDYEKHNDCNKNTPESLTGGGAEDLGITLRTVTSPGVEPNSATMSLSLVSNLKPPLSRSPASSSPLSSSQKRVRAKGAVDGLGNKKLPTLKRSVSTVTTDASSTKSTSENPAFSNRSARAAAGKRERKGKCVLCVEDNIINLRVVQYQLQKLGYETQSACDGQVAVDIIKAQIEMLGQGMADMDLNAGSPGVDGSSQDVLMKSRGDYEIPRQPYQLSIGNGLMVISESNGNKSHIFDQSDAWSPYLQRTENGGASPQSSSPSTSVVSPYMDPLSNEQFLNLSRPGSIHSSTGTPTLGPSPLSTMSGAPRPAQIDLILMDCAMPVKSGFDAASEIRTMGERSAFAAKIPIIALTASAVPSTKEKCLAAGMNGYLSKPTKLCDLEAMLDQWIE
ncbi:hypothetical protein BGZ52_010564 [Haplosporangium bisporale]|nr:hypothetical protein BGZ52_010564 [Haplosporangium bisporale]